MGFGCNACGVVGCRIIASPRERLLAILTNAMVPCNGRFPTLIVLISLFFAGGMGGWTAAVLLTGLVLLGVAGTLLSSKLLSGTVLRGMPSAFALELPPYRRPQVGKVLVRSVLDRTVYVLGRAVLTAAPAGLVIWVLANVAPGGVSLLARLAGGLDPLGRVLGMNGVILAAFLLGLPANELVLPILVLALTGGGVLADVSDTAALGVLLQADGWTWVTALCTMVFTVFHWPCATTCLTICRETKSLRWTALAIALPTALGMALCAVLHLVFG
jgi:ferrous iron transport protein B